MEFKNAYFIKADAFFDKNDKCNTHAPMFRRKFICNETIKKAEIRVCGLGYGYCWINGEKVTEDLFTAPVSDYNKTLWYNSYDVTELIKQGENVIAVLCGNGWYNEVFSTAWNYNEAKWRDNPKFILELIINGKQQSASDNEWKCKRNSAIVYNQLRSGEHFDSRVYDEEWNALGYDDSGWRPAVIDDNPPCGTLRRCVCEPVRECETYPAKDIIAINDNVKIFDIGQNISGYIRLRVKGKNGAEIKIRYAEEINDDLSLRFNGMDGAHFYPESVFQEDSFICDGSDFTWSPMFAYHGFRFIRITGLEDTEYISVTGVFVHQDVGIRSGFKCSDYFLNRLFYIGKMATLSNLFYAPTDCPTREKLGWANDAQASAEQMLMNFETEKFFEKWLRDIFDAMRSDGALPGIIPTCGWGYQWGNGPVSDGVLFEVPYQLYLQTGNKDMLCESLPYFKKYFSYLETKTNEEGFIEFGLDDWSAPIKERKVFAPFINSVLKIKFLRIAMLSTELCKNENDDFSTALNSEIRLVKNTFINNNGTCSINEQTAVAMLIYFGIYDDLAPLKEQLKMLVEQQAFHHLCGMVGLRYLYDALNICELEEYAYKILTASGFPSFRDWIDNGATTLGEYWDMSVSKNHHMYSSYMAWIMRTVIGIRQGCGEVGYEKVEIKPYFFKKLDYATGYCNTVKGKISVSWRRKNRSIEIEICIPIGIDAYYGGKRLNSGRNRFKIGA